MPSGGRRNIWSVLKRCGRCTEYSPHHAFNRAGDGRQHWCRDCFRAYFQERGDRHRVQVAKSRDARREPLRRLLLEHFATHPCVDCGEDDARVLEFDHVGRKRSSIGVLLNRGARPSEVEVEMGRCVVVCANCHRRRTAKRGQWGRVTDSEPADSARRPRRTRNLRWVYASWRGARCVDCNLADPLLLEHDHIGEKRAGVMALAWSEYAIDQLEAEIERCEVRCCNCHRRRTAAVRGCFRAAAVTLAEGL
jgi:hypothetical protein